MGAYTGVSRLTVGELAWEGVLGARARPGHFCCQPQNFPQDGAQLQLQRTHPRIWSKAFQQWIEFRGYPGFRANTQPSHMR